MATALCMIFLFLIVVLKKVPMYRQLPQCVPRISEEAQQLLNQISSVLFMKFVLRVFHPQPLANQSLDA